MQFFKFILIIIVTILVQSSFAQVQVFAISTNIDSLVKILPNLQKEKKLDILFAIIDAKIISLDLNNLVYIDQANKIAKEIDDEHKLNEIKLLYGTYWKIFGDYKKSSESILSAISYFEQNHDDFHLQKAYRILGETYRSTNMQLKSLDYLNKAYKICKSMNQKRELAQIYNRLSAVYFERYLGIEVKKSKYYAEQSLKLIDTTDDSHTYISNLILLGAIERFFGDYQKAEYYFMEALRLSEKYDDSYNYHSVLTNLASNYILKKEMQNALQVALKCVEFSEKHKLENISLYLYQVLVEIYEKMGDLKNALKYSQTASSVSQDIYFAKRDFVLTDLTQKYETEKKLMELEEQKTKQYYIITIFIIAVIFLIGILILYRNRHKLVNNKNKTISEQNSQLKELNATKDKFFSIIAHDLRSPISTFKNITEIMESDFENMPDEDKIEFIGLMKKSSVHISELLENLLTWSRSQRGKIDFIPAPVELSIFIDANINLLELQASKKNISLISDYPEEVQAFADVNMVNTVLRNLISNAIKFTPQDGKIIVKAEVEESIITFSVIDNGIGMTPENMKKIFRIDDNLTTLGTNNEKGTGLGLIICKEFIEKHDGKIWVESELGKGSAFKFTVPLSNQ